MHRGKIMSKDNGFLEYERVPNGDIPPLERIKDFKEFHVYLDGEGRIRQAARCMDCGVPFCQSAMKLSGMVTGCPLHNLIPEWNKQVYEEHYELAYGRLSKTSNFPEFTGRVCPALCEKACINGEHSEPTTVHDNELFIIETAFEKGYIKPSPPKVRSTKKVAVVGSGPSGLAAADTLNKRGHFVDVYERDDRIGGLLMYGIPNQKLDKSVIERRQRLMEEEGVNFLTNKNIESSADAKDLLARYDAVVLCCGAKKPRGLDAADPSKDKGVYFAVDFLKSTTQNLMDCGIMDRSVKELKEKGKFISAENKHVVVVGGGDTGNDCIGTSIRHGAKSVTAIEMMPKPPEERLSSNPWPEWPKTLKTDYGHQEAIALYGKDPRVYETTVKEIKKDKKGQIKKVVTSKVSFKDGKLSLVEGTQKEIPCDLLLIAAGFLGGEDYVYDAFGVKKTPRGTAQTEEGKYKTSAQKVFAAGDFHRGQSLVVWGIREGRECAREVDEFLMGYTN